MYIAFPFSQCSMVENVKSRLQPKNVKSVSTKKIIWKDTDKMIVITFYDIKKIKCKKVGQMWWQVAALSLDMFMHSKLHLIHILTV